MGSFRTDRSVFEKSIAGRRFHLWTDTSPPGEIVSDSVKPDARKAGSSALGIGPVTYIGRRLRGQGACLRLRGAESPVCGPPGSDVVCLLLPRARRAWFAPASWANSEQTRCQGLGKTEAGWTLTICRECANRDNRERAS
jgi:hypothetical protein